MTTFEVGDTVFMPGWDVPVTVLELGTCCEASCGQPAFRFADPDAPGDDWMHVASFKKSEPHPTDQH